MSSNINAQWSGAIESTHGTLMHTNLGGVIAIVFPRVEGPASTDSSVITMNSLLPEDIRPSVKQVATDRMVISGGKQVKGKLSIGTDGSVTISADGGFTTTGTNGFICQGFSYNKGF